MRGVAYALGASETPHESAATTADAAELRRSRRRQTRVRRSDADHSQRNESATTPGGSSRWHDRRRSSAIRRRCRSRKRRWIAIYGLPYTRRPHPSYTRADPRVRDDQGLGDDHARLLRRLHVLLDHGAPRPDHPVAQQGIGARRNPPDDRRSRVSRGSISDIGGPTANMYQMKCTQPEVEAVCRRQSCVHPTICKLLGTDHGPLIELMNEARETAGHQEGARRQRHPHGPGPPLAGVHARAGRSITSAAI